jgi:hypothetical protein
MIAATIGCVIEIPRNPSYLRNDTGAPVFHILFDSWLTCEQGGLGEPMLAV